MMSVDELNAVGDGKLPAFLGIVVTDADRDALTATLAIGPQHMAPNGYLHAGTVIALADTAAGYATVTNLPDGASGFTTIELKSNHLGTAREGTLTCTATPHHRGRTTQVWDAVVRHAETDRTIALYRCTQMLLYPRAAAG